MHSRKELNYQKSDTVIFGFFHSSESYLYIFVFLIKNGEKKSWLNAKKVFPQTSLTNI